MSLYCIQSDVYGWIPRGSVQNPARLVSSVSASTDTLTLDGHGLAVDDELLFRAEAGGSLPSPLVAGTGYYAIPVTDSTFKVAAAAGGAVVDLTTAGSNVVMVAELPWAKWIEEASNELECTMPAHTVPIGGTVPAIVRAYCAGLVAERALAHCGVRDYGVEARLERTRRELERWRKGVPVRGTNRPASANAAVRSTEARVDVRGWASRGNHIP